MAADAPSAAISATPLVVAALPAFLALVATFIAAAVGAWVTWIVARSKARTDIVTAGRQAWISALRDDLAELFQSRTALNDLDSELAYDAANKALQDARTEAAEKVRLLRARILLRMDETKKTGRTNPQIALSLTVRAFTDERAAYSEVLADELITNGQSVLDTAWGQVKRLK